MRFKVATLLLSGIGVLWLGFNVAVQHAEGGHVDPPTVVALLMMAGIFFVVLLRRRGAK